MNFPVKYKVSKKLVLFVLVLGIISILFLKSKNSQEIRGLFSWKSDEVIEGSTQLFETMEDFKLNTLYQQFSRKIEEEEIIRFLENAKERNIEVFLLDGNPKWALDKDGKSMIKVVDRVIKINKGLDEKDWIKSIVFDVEPYLLDEWNEESKEGIMDSFISGMKAVYEKASASKLEVIVCIPYYYDTIGLDNQLEELIKTGSDSIAIMNYFRENEVNHIEQEVEFADKYGKKIINIYELQAPGEYGLKDINTYYNEGISAAEKSFKKIRNELNGKDISIAFHEYRALKEILSLSKGTR